jgi:hypothetical protein
VIIRYIRPEQVIVLILSDENDTPYQSQLFRSMVSMKRFINLRALKFIELDDDGKFFFSDLFKMKELVSFEIDVKLILPLIMIPSSIERLVINICPEVHYYIDESISMIQYERLRYLSLRNCSCKQLQKIFSEAIRLTSLKISLQFVVEEELVTFINIHSQEMRIPPLVSLSLDINATGEYRTYNHLFLFFSFCFLVDQ